MHNDIEWGLDWEDGWSAALILILGQVVFFVDWVIG